MPFLKAFLVFLLTTQLQAQTQTPVFPNLTGEELFFQVVANYKTTTVLDYGPARDTLYGTIDIRNDSVSGIYTGHKIYLPPGVDPSTHLFMNGVSDGINTEHSYPRSKGARDGNGFSDMHHLFPSRTAVNASRSNFPFADIDDNVTTSWFYLNQTQSNTPTVEIDRYSERINGAFEPRESKKGDIARAMIYFYTMYQEEALAADPDFFEVQRETFCRWHREDPVDEVEWDRTLMISEYQDDLPNPFILDSTLVGRMYCEETTAVGEVGEADFNIFPNPVVDTLYVECNGRALIQVLNGAGQFVIEVEAVNTASVDFSTLTAGTYVVSVNGQVQRVVKL